MSDDFGNFVQEAAPYAPAAYGAYKVGQRYGPFVQGAIDSSMGAQVGTMAARALGGSTVRQAAGMTAGRIAGVTAARVGIGAGASAASGAAAGSIVPGVGTLAGLAVGALAPLVIPHTPFAGMIRKIPIIGHILSPKNEERKTKIVGGPAPPAQARNPHFYVNPENSHFVGESSPHVVGPGTFSRQNRAEYEAGRGFRR